MPTTSLSRRKLLEALTAMGLGGSVFPEAVWAEARRRSELTESVDPVIPNRTTQSVAITTEIIAAAEQVAGLTFTTEERELMVEGLNEALEDYAAIRTVTIPNSVPPALFFDPLLGRAPAVRDDPARVRHRRPRVTRPQSDTELAFLPVTHLAELIRTRKVSSKELTNLYLDRLRRYGDTLECVVSLTEELALEQAARADTELARGRYRGPLHGIPWGAKDLLATKGYRTTWGAKPYEDQVVAEDATVVSRLEEAGAVLVAKLTLGALAWGDVWFGGKTRNPWNLEQGSSGSSAGPAAATVAGLVGFAIGSETWGSIVSPATRCGATGLRPTFGRVSRHGAMALSWSMDKLGPLCRSVEDCALVLEAIAGPDGIDPTVRDVPFSYDGTRSLERLRVGYLRAAFEEDHRTKTHDEAALAVIGTLGVSLEPIELPQSFPTSAISFILSAEAATAFDDLTRSNRDDLLTRQVANAWPNVFRQSRFIPAVEYLQANRLRTMLIQATDAALADIDVLIAPSFGQDILLRTNLTGHPAVVVPSGFAEGAPASSLSFIGQLFDEESPLLLARAFEAATDYHQRHPPSFLDV